MNEVSEFFYYNKPNVVLVWKEAMGMNGLAHIFQEMTG
jgi:hypothetical protein